MKQEVKLSKLSKTWHFNYLVKFMYEFKGLTLK